jgi:hypothetical protein
MNNAEVIPCTEQTPCLACAEGLRIKAEREAERKARERRNEMKQRRVRK